MPLPLPLAGVKDQDVRFALEKVAEHAAAKSDSYLNAKDFGMVGDGVADNLIAFNKAIAALNNAGGALYIPPGTYNLSAVPDAITGSNITIFGAGPATQLRFSTGNNHGTFFTLGTTDNVALRTTICDMTLNCAQVTPPADEHAFKLVRSSFTSIYNLGCVEIGGLCENGTATTPAIAYTFQNITGTWNAATPSPKRIHIVYAADGRFSGVRLTAIEVNGGTMVRADVASGGFCDQHFFDSCTLWSEGAYSHASSGHGTTYDGHTWNVYLDFTNGPLQNWNFHKCVLDEGTAGSVNIVSSSGGFVCQSIHFVDCHHATNGGFGFRVNHAGTGEFRDFQIIGGRVRYVDSNAVNLTGANIVSALVSGVSMLQDNGDYTSANTVRDSIVHGYKHGLAVDDALIFTGSPPAPLVAGTTYYVKNADANSDGKEFTLSATTPASGGATINITASASGSYYVFVDGAFKATNATGFRVTNCHMGPFSGSTCNTDYAALGTGAPDLYIVAHNTSRGMVSGFASGLTTAGTSKILTNNPH